MEVGLLTTQGVTVVAAGSTELDTSLGQLQFTLGEGPCLSAVTSRRPVLEPSLGSAAARRWPMFVPAATALGTRAAFAFPLQVGAAQLGVLGIYRTTIGSLDRSALAHAFGYAQRAVDTIVDSQARAGSSPAADTPDDAMPGPDSSVASDPIGHQVPMDAEDVLGPQYAIYQAQGIVMVDLAVTLSDAMVRLRAYAFRSGRPLSCVAADVVSGRLHLERDLP